MDTKPEFMDRKPELVELDYAIRNAARSGASTVMSIMRTLKCDLPTALRILTAHMELEYYSGAKPAIMNELDEMTDALKKEIAEQAEKDKAERESNTREAIVHPDLADPGKEEEEPAK